MFRITQGKGFGVGFPNGYRLSVQFGPVNYCDNKNYECVGELNDAQTRAGAEGCANAEIAVVQPDGEFMELIGDSVAGYVTPTQVACIMTVLAANVSPERTARAVREVLSDPDLMNEPEVKALTP
jgi:hypothetical protein